MKKLVLVLGMIFTATNVNATAKGFYLGAGLGNGNIYRPQFYPDVTTSNGSSGFAGRVDFGYQFTRYFATELGYTKFSTSNVTYSQIFFDDVFLATASIESYALDAVVRATLPFDNGFSLFGKAGIAYINENGGTINLTDPNGFVSSTLSINESKVLPTFGLGAGYLLNKNFTADLAWMRIQNVGSNGFLGTDIETLGLTYYFG